VQVILPNGGKDVEVHDRFVADWSATMLRVRRDPEYAILGYLNFLALHPKFHAALDDINNLLEWVAMWSDFHARLQPIHHQ